MKTKIITLFACALSCLTIVKAQANPIKPIYEATFENVEKNSFEEKVLTIQGKQWHFVNARITSDSLSWIPEGRKAVEIMTGGTKDNPPRLELMEPIRGKAICFGVGFSGVDEFISGPQKDWQLQVTYDDGQTWASMRISIDVFPSTISFAVPDENKPFRLRFVYLGDSNVRGKGCRILIDNVRITDPEDLGEPWEVRVGKLYDGYCTPDSKISFKPIVLGTGWFLGEPGDDWGPNTYITAQIDDRPPVTVGTVNDKTLVTFDNLTPGKHTITTRFVNLKTGKPFEGVDPHTTIDFYVRPPQKIQGLAALRKGKEGEMYEVTPEDGKPILANYWFHIHAQKWLFDGKNGIILDDPMQYNYARKIQPEKKIAVKKMRGQLIRLNNNLMFRITEPLVLDTLNEKFTFENQTIEDLSILTKPGNIEKYEGMSVALSKVCFSALVENPEAILYPISNESFEIQDVQGNKLSLQNIYPHNFIKSEIFKETEQRLPAVYLDIFGIVGKSFPGNKPAVFPLVMIKSDYQSVKEVFTPQHIDVLVSNGIIAVESDLDTDLSLYDISGRLVNNASIAANTKCRLTVPPGCYLLRASLGNGKVEVVKCCL